MKGWACLGDVMRYDEAVILLFVLGAIRLGNLSKGEPRNLVSYASPTSGMKRGDRKGVPTSVEKRKAGIRYGIRHLTRWQFHLLYH